MRKYKGLHSSTDIYSGNVGALRKTAEANGKKVQIIIENVMYKSGKICYNIYIFIV